jgi:hypothetical protein
MYQVIGEMVPTNVAVLSDRSYHFGSKIFGAIMDSNMMDLQVKDNGKVEINSCNTIYRSHLTLDAFTDGLSMFLSRVPELEFEGSFNFIVTSYNTEPILSKVVVSKGEVSSHDAVITWNVNG